MGKDKTFISSFGEVRPIHHIVDSLANNTFNKDPLAARIAMSHLPRFEEVSKLKVHKEEAAVSVKKKTTPKVPSARAKPGTTPGFLKFIANKKEKQG